MSYLLRFVHALLDRRDRDERLVELLIRDAQIVDGEPSPAVERILDAFEGDSAWTIALWLNAPSGWLGGERPLDLLAEQPDRVVEAARKTTEPLAV